MIPRFKRQNKGFTLLEIVIALAILTIGLVGVLALFPTGLRASKRGGDFTSAAIAAQQVMETIKRAGFSAYSAGQYPPGFTGPGEAVSAYTHDEGSQTTASTALPEGFSWASSVVNDVSNLRQVTVSIYWIDRGGYRQENFVTYLADYN